MAVKVLSANPIALLHPNLMDGILRSTKDHSFLILKHISHLALIFLSIHISYFYSTLLLSLFLLFFTFEFFFPFFPFYCYCTFVFILYFFISFSYLFVSFFDPCFPLNYFLLFITNS